jgi:hypothetical protein
MTKLKINILEDKEAETHKAGRKEKYWEFRKGDKIDGITKVYATYTTMEVLKNWDNW